MSATAPVAIGTAVDARSEPANLARSLRQFAPLVAAALACAIAASLVAPYPVGIFHDDGVYLILAKSLAGGSGYRYLHLPGAPFATHYPPAYPLLLAALWRLAPTFPSNLTIILLANAALLGVVAWGVARYATTRLGWSPLAAATLGLIGTISLPLIQLTTLVMSEVMFVACLFPLLGYAEWSVASRRRATDALPLGAAAGALTLVRAHGIVLVAALVLVLALRRQWKRSAIVAAGAAIVVLAWALWISLHDTALPEPLRGSYGSYLGWFITGVHQGGPSFVGHTVMRNALECAAILADRFAPWPPGPTRIIPLALLLGLIAAGIWRVRRRAPVTVAFTAAYFAVTLLWPYTPWRFVWGIWPLVLILAVEGAFAVGEWRPVVAGGVAAWYVLRAAVAVLALGVVRAEVTAYRERAWATPMRDATRQIAPVMRWINQNTRPHEIVIADAEPLVYLFTQRPAMPPVAFTAAEYLGRRSAAADSASLDQLVRHYPVRYIVTVVPSTIAAARRLSSTRAGQPISLRQVDSLPPNGAVFEVVRP